MSGRGVIRELPSPQDGYSESCVSVLTAALEAAARGELVGVAIAGMRRGGDAYTGVSESASRYALMGALFQMAHDLADLAADEE